MILYAHYQQEKAALHNSKRIIWNGIECYGYLTFKMDTSLICALTLRPTPVYFTDQASDLSLILMPDPSPPCQPLLSGPVSSVKLVKRDDIRTRTSQYPSREAQLAGVPLAAAHRVCTWRSAARWLCASAGPRRRWARPVRCTGCRPGTRWPRTACAAGRPTGGARSGHAGSAGQCRPEPWRGGQGVFRCGTGAPGDHRLDMHCISCRSSGHNIQT